VGFDATPMLDPSRRVDVLVRDLPAALAEILRRVKAVDCLETR
jgi:hypothetical protein